MMKSCLIAFVLVTCHSVIFAGDWPQILGPGRDGIAIGEKLAESWPGGPEVVWTAPAGQGFAGVSVADGRALLFHRIERREVLQAFDAVTGDVLWQSADPCDYRCGLSSDSGPRCVPVIAGSRVITFGAAGVLRCCDVETGREIWKRDTWKDFRAPEGYFGAGSTPLIVGDRVIVNVGGRSNAAVVAFSIKDGSTLWQAFDDTASYSAPVLTTIGGQEHVIVVTRLNVVSLNPKTGNIQFQFPFGARGPTVNGATPVVLGERLFVSASYRVGSVLADIAAEPNPRSSGESLLATQYATPIRFQNVLFAMDGRQDFDNGSLCCIDPVGQEVLWRQPGISYGTLVRVDEELLLLTCGGELVRFRANTENYDEVSRHQILSATGSGYRLPALSSGRLYVRDDDTLKCLKVGP